MTVAMDVVTRTSRQNHVYSTQHACPNLYYQKAATATVLRTTTSQNAQPAPMQSATNFNSSIRMAHAQLL